MRVTNRYKNKTAEIYKKFSRDCFDFSDSALSEMFLHDSLGMPDISIENTNNGYFIGKFWMSVTINMWKEDLNDRLLTAEELRNDFPDWFLKRIGIWQ